MATEIEYKYLVKKELLPDLTKLECVHIIQGYLSDKPAVRVRLSDLEGYLTIKGSGMISRDEYEYQIPYSDAFDMLRLCPSNIIKKRYKLPIGDVVWEIDVFEDALEGLILAEVEVPSVDYWYAKPEWLGEDVTKDPQYKNVNLARKCI